MGRHGTYGLLRVKKLLNGPQYPGRVFNLEVGNLVPRARLLLAVTPRSDKDGAHTQQLRRHDIIVDAIPNHDAFGGVHTQVLADTHERVEHRAFAGLARH